MLAVARGTGALERAVDRFIVPSRAVAEALAGSAIPAERVAIKPNFVATAASPRATADRPETYLFAGRLAPEKGVPRSFPRGPSSVTARPSAGSLDPAA